MDGDGDITDLALLNSVFGLNSDHCTQTAPLTLDEYDRADINDDCVINVSDLAVLLDNFGSPAAPALAWRYDWDAENRLTAVVPTLPVAGAKKVAFAYDYLGRRAAKTVWDWNPSGGGGGGAWESVPSLDRRFIYHGWNLILELDARDLAGGTDPNTPGGGPDGQPDNSILRRYVWGLDLGGQSQPSGDREGAGSASLQRAGGIGGLLAIEDTAGTTLPGTGPGGDPLADDRRFACLYDGNGNLTQLVDMTFDAAGQPAATAGTIAAKYVYDPFGQILSQSGDYADANPIRFSTKYFDPETGLSYFGQRYYNATWGRFVNPDPIEEAGGINLYAFVGNDPINSVDPLGLVELSAFITPGGTAIAITAQDGSNPPFLLGYLNPETGFVSMPATNGPVEVPYEMIVEEAAQQGTWGGYLRNDPTTPEEWQAWAERHGLRRNKCDGDDGPNGRLRNVLNEREAALAEASGEPLSADQIADNDAALGLANQAANSLADFATPGPLDFAAVAMAVKGAGSAAKAGNAAADAAKEAKAARVRKPFSLRNRPTDFRRLQRDRPASPASRPNMVSRRR